MQGLAVSCSSWRRIFEERSRLILGPRRCCVNARRVSGWIRDAFSVIARKSQPGQVEPAVEYVMFSFGAGDVLLDFRACCLDKSFQRCALVRCGSQDLSRKFGPMLQIS